MALSSNKLQKIVDLPVWEWMRFAPLTADGKSVMVKVPYVSGSGQPYNQAYFLSTQQFSRYDMISDSWTYFGNVFPINPNNMHTATWKIDDGHYGYAISASGSQMVGGFGNQKQVVGYKVKILTGKGRGQVRNIVDCTEPTIVDTLTVTAYNNNLANTNYITDSNKRWRVNQWRNYQVRVYLGTAQQVYVRKVIYNNHDTLFFANIDYHAIDPHQAYNHVTEASWTAPAANVSRATIEYNTITVDQPWTVQPDDTSKYVVMCGTLHVLSNRAGATNYYHHRYDPIYGSWLAMHAMYGVYPAAQGLDLGIISIDSSLTPKYLTGSITNVTGSTIIDSSQSLFVNEFSNYRFFNTTTGQSRTILSSGTSSFRIAECDIPNNIGDSYYIDADDDKLYASGQGYAAMSQFSLRTNSWAQQQRFDEGVVNNGFVRYSSSFEQMFPIFNITRTGSVGLVTTIVPHPFKDGDRIIIGGATGSDASIYNVEGVVTSSYFLSGSNLTSATGPTLFSYGLPSTPSANAGFNAITTNIVFDASKNWINNQWSGSCLVLYSNSYDNPTMQFRLIVGNTSQSLVVSPVLTTAVNTGVWGYQILSSASFGAAAPIGTGSYQFSGSTISGLPFLFVSASNSASLNPIPYGAPITGSSIPAGTTIRSFQQSGSIIQISINANALSTTNDIGYTSSLEASAGYGVATGGSTTTLVDAAKNWQPNQWIGARLKFLAGNNANQEVTISSNTANTITFGALGAAVDSNVLYSIIPVTTRSTGFGMTWIYSGSMDPITPDSAGKYIYTFDGGNNNMRLERYNVNTMQFEFVMPQAFSTQLGEALNTGTQYAYDGGTRVYVQPNSSNRVYYIDTVTGKVDNAGQIPYGQAAQVLGQRSFVAETEDGLKYLYILRNNGTEFWRTLLFW